MTDPAAPKPATAPPAEKYNPMYEVFVGSDTAGEQDLTSLIAYALYKKAKRQWILKTKSEKKRQPTAEELVAYYETWTQTTIDALRDRAQASLAAFGESVVEDARPGIEKEAVRGKLSTDVGHGMLTNFVYTLALIATVIVLQWSGVDLLEILEKAKPHSTQTVPAPDTGATHARPAHGAGK